jgi:hypothetical protein
MRAVAPLQRFEQRQISNCLFFQPSDFIVRVSGVQDSEVGNAGFRLRDIRSAQKSNGRAVTRTVLGLLVEILRFRCYSLLFLLVLIDAADELQQLMFL